MRSIYYGSRSWGGWRYQGRWPSWLTWGWLWPPCWAPGRGLRLQRRQWESGFHECWPGLSSWQVWRQPHPQRTHHQGKSLFIVIDRVRVVHIFIKRSVIWRTALSWFFSAGCSWWQLPILWEYATGGDKACMANLGILVETVQGERHHLGGGVEMLWDMDN